MFKREIPAQSLKNIDKQKIMCYNILITEKDYGI